MRTALALTLFFAITAYGRSAVDAVNKDGKGVAVKGYDVVAYFRQSAPVKGSPEFKQEWMGATWLFSSAENRDLFAGDPDKYAPRYGGYCAYAVSEGHTASIDPEAWRIAHSRLYLNYSKGVQKKWEKDQATRIDRANRNWPRLHK